MAHDRQIPQFRTEAEEARWWDKQGSRMARDMEAAVAARDLPFTVAPSRTSEVPLLGAVGSQYAESRARIHPGAAGLASHQVRHLVRRYGTLALKVLPMETPEDDGDEGHEPFRDIVATDDAVLEAEVTPL